MLKQFESNIVKKQLFSKTDKLIVALSGGVDSVVLVYLLQKLNYDFILAHCNFKLRGKDSLQDELFCKNIAKKLKVPFYSVQFDTNSYATSHKMSIQMAARELRYNWLNTICDETKTSYILTAHHANDLIETVFINMLRGTGINGLKGIAEKSKNLVRPLLFATKVEVEQYAKENSIAFRLDKSNLEDKYERNFIRLNVIPSLKKLNPTFERTFIENTHRWKEEGGIVSSYLSDRWSKLAVKNNNKIVLKKQHLLSEPFLESLLNFGLKDFGFSSTQFENIITNLNSNGNSGKIFTTSTHQLTIASEDLVVQVKDELVFNLITFQNLNELKKSNYFKLYKLNSFQKPNQNNLLVNPNQLLFPLTIRTPQKGDKFQPFGMKGFKLLSDFLKDLKLNTFEKKSCKLLVNGNNDIIWVIGLRSDNRYRVSENETNYYKFTWLENK